MKIRIVISSIVLVFAFACQRGATPKPRGYFRIDLPAKKYMPIQEGLPFTFNIPGYSSVSAYDGLFSDDTDAAYWLNVDFPDFSAHIHLTYKTVENNLRELIDDAYTFAYKHAARAEAINQLRFSNENSDVHGIIYHIKGNTASSIQFFCTDSVENFLRGALYFDSEPNKDSLAPVISFLGEDINELMESLKWNKKTN